MPSSNNSLASAIQAAVLRIPKGKVATYGQVAEVAGFPGYHRQVAQVLSRYGHMLPWQRVVGAGGAIRTSTDTAVDQRLRLEMEGVRFRGKRVDLKASGWVKPLTGRRDRKTK